MKVSFCFIAFVLLISSLYMSIMKKDESIIFERSLIYGIGMLLGLGIGLSYFMNNRKEPYLFCKVIAIIYIVKLGFYYLFPKSPLMLYSLTTKQQTDAWADIYSEMKNRWKISLFVGFIGYLFLGFALTRK